MKHLTFSFAVVFSWEMKVHRNLSDKWCLLELRWKPL